ncbi:MAG: PilZ domain-containing protein, partial [Pseudomonadota bacterium]
AYVDRPMIAGLQPETFASFIGQRSRWCQGMLQILMLKNPLVKQGLSIPQRICYLSSMIFWFFPLARLTFLIAPLFYLFFGASIFVASGAEFAAYTVTYILVNIMLQNYLWHRVRWPFISELYETIQSVYLVRALGAVLVSPKKAKFRVTAKGETNRVSRISELGAPFYIIFAVLVVGVVATVLRVLSGADSSDVAMVVGGWNLFNLILVGAALGVVAERRQLRTSQRLAIERPAEIVYGDRVINVKVDDVSTTGARVIVPVTLVRPVAPGDKIILRFETMAPLPSNELPLLVRSVSREPLGNVIGAEFAVADAGQYRQVADLVFANSQEWVRFQASRRTDMGVLPGVIEFLTMSAFQTLRGLSYLVVAPAKRKARPERPAGPSEIRPPGRTARTAQEAEDELAHDGGRRQQGGRQRQTSAQAATTMTKL